MTIIIAPIENGESGKSVRDKLNRMIGAAGDGTIGGVTPEDLENLIDTTPPAVPRGLRVDSPWELGAFLQIDWNANIENDFAYYDLQVREAGGNWISYQTSINGYRLAATPGLSYIIRIRAVDKSGNASAYSANVTIVGHENTERPAAPIGLSISAGTESIWVKWTANLESDLAYYEVYESSLNFVPTDADAATFVTSGNTISRTGILPETTRYYWVRAVNTSNNKSPWSIGVSATTGKLKRNIVVTLTDVTFTPMSGGVNRIAWSSGQIHYGEEGAAPTTQNLTSGAAVYSGERIYIKYILGESALTTTVSLLDLYSSQAILIGVYKGSGDFQLVMGKAYTDGSMILAQTIGANQLIADQAVITGTAQIANAIITNAKIVELDAAKLIAGTVLAGSIKINNTALNDLEQYALDPAGRVNDGETLIEPGRILVAGSTTLENWKNGPDSTEINGGVISADTIKANSLVIGQRGIDIQNIIFSANTPDPNFVSWSSGSISYMSSEGNQVTALINSGNAPWSSGVRYIYWKKDAVTLTVTGTYATALADDAVLLATYMGGTALTVTSGRTTIEGSMIRTGSIAAEQLSAGAVTANKIAVVNLAAINAQLGHILGGSLNINNRFIVDADGNVTIQNAPTGARLMITNTLIMVYDANGILRVRLGIW